MSELQTQSLFIGVPSMAYHKAVKEALNALYHHPDDAVRADADRWLQEFQGFLDAWQVLYVMLIVVFLFFHFWWVFVRLSEACESWWIRFWFKSFELFGIVIMYFFPFSVFSFHFDENWVFEKFEERVFVNANVNNSKFRV